MKPTLALDGDGVLVDFNTPALEYLNSRGIKKTHAQTTDWSVFDNDEELETAYKRDVVAHPDFCRNMKPYPGAIHFVQAARREYEILIVTAPYSVPNWYEGRRDWMVEKLDIPSKDVCFLSRKEFFDSDILVDDKVENVVAWANQRDVRRDQHADNSLPVVMDQPWNRVNLPSGVRRALSWKDLAFILEVSGYPRLRGIL